MEKFIIDTNILLWDLFESSKITNQTLNILDNNEIYFSQISLFEIQIKTQINKLPQLNMSFNNLFEVIKDNGYCFLEIMNPHLEYYTKIPLIPNHRDPFDRLLVATALNEGLSILTGDVAFSEYSNLVKVHFN